MTKAEIQKEIDRVECAIFMEQMADFMNWENYFKLKTELNDLKSQLNSAE